MEEIKLTVQSNGNEGFRLGINTKDSIRIFGCRRVIVHLYLGKDIEKIECKTACGLPCDENSKQILTNPITKKKYKKGYDLNKKEISVWIKNEGFVPPNKLLFTMEKTEKIVSLRFLNKETKQS